MTDLINIILPILMAEASNILAALICIITLCGAHPRLCLALTLLVHLGLILL